jgi:uncharacterized protein (TIGR02453 family)
MNIDDDFKLPKELLSFLKNLENNNNKEWFDQHREKYQNFFVEPLKDLTEHMGDLFTKKLPGLNALPKVNGSLFRINRDIRFSKDKRPYKTHASTFCWVGAGKKMQCPGLYFHIDARTLMIGAGLHTFDPSLIGNFRQYADRHGVKLQKAINKGLKAGFETGGEQYKRVPKPYDKDHKHGDLLRYKGVHLGKKFPAKIATKPGLLPLLKKELTPAIDFVLELEKALF